MLKSLMLFAFSSVMFAQPTPLGLVLVFNDGTTSPVALGPGLVLSQSAVGQALTIRVAFPDPPPPVVVTPAPVYRFYASSLRQLSDGTWTPTVVSEGAIIPASFVLMKNGVFQEDNFDFRFDSSNNSIRLLFPLMVDDRLFVKFTTVGQ